MANDRHLEKSQFLHNGLTDFDQIWNGDHGRFTCLVPLDPGGGYIGIYTQKKISLPYKFLCGYWLSFDIVSVCALAKLAVKIPPK